MSKFGKIVFIGFVLILLIISIFYILFYSVSIANEPSIIKLRRSYYTILSRIRESIGLGGDNYTYLRSPVRVYSKNQADGEFIYGFIGRLEYVDFDRQQISLNCCRGKTFIFKATLLSDPINREKITFVNPTKGNISVESSAYTNRYFSLVWKNQDFLRQILDRNQAEPDLSLNFSSNPPLLEIRELEN